MVSVLLIQYRSHTVRTILPYVKCFLYTNLILEKRK